MLVLWLSSMNNATHFSVSEFIETYEPPKHRTLSLQQAELLRRSITELKLSLTSLNKVLTEQEITLRMLCPHNLEPFVVDSVFQSGDYLNVAETEHVIKCRTCGTILGSFVEQHQGRYS